MGAGRVRARARRNNGNGGDGGPNWLRPEEKSLNIYVLWQAYVLMAVTGLGYLALTWSTVVLLGGFVTTLGRKDFWCLTAISMIHAARILSDTEKMIMLDFWILVDEMIDKSHHILFRRSRDIPNACFFGFVGFLCLLLIPVVLVLELLYVSGSAICVGLSLWRLVQRDYGNTDSDSTQENLMPALEIFYSLVLCQGALFFLWYANNFRAQPLVASLSRACNFPKKWGRITIQDYLLDTRAKCRQDPASIKGRNVVNYAVDLLDSKSVQDYLSGARMLDMFIKQGVDLRSLLLPSRPKIQKLIDTLRWRSSKREITECAARIVAHLAWDIDLTQYPGAIRCVSSLLDTTLPYWNNRQGENHQLPKSKLEQSTATEQELVSRGKKLDQRGAKERKSQEGDDKQGAGGSFIDERGDGWNVLILQSLTILERLASDEHNCRDICATPDLLPKIMAPIYSDTLIQDISVSARENIVNGSFRLVYQLIRAQGWTGRRLRREMSASKQAISNLEMILDYSNKANKKLQTRAIQILTELALDLSTNLTMDTKEYLIKKQLQIFLTGYGEEDPATMFIRKNKLKVTAGETLALLSKTETTSAFIIREYNSIFYHLSEVLDAKSNTIYMIVALAILENLCTNCTLDGEYVKESLLSKVLMKVLAVLMSKRERPTEASQRTQYWVTILSASRIAQMRRRKCKAWEDDEEIDGFSSEDDDEENRLSRHSSRSKSSYQASKEQTDEMKLQEALLSLTLVICNKLMVGGNDSDNLGQKIPNENGEIVVMLKAIVEENCQATAGCLRTVKLCGQIAVSMMRCNQYIAQFKDHNFVESLSKASEIMSNLESCMFFAGTDCGLKKTARPFLSDLEKELKEATKLVG